MKRNTYSFGINWSPKCLKNKRGEYWHYRSHKTFIKTRLHFLQNLKQRFNNSFRASKSGGEKGNGTYVIQLKYKCICTELLKVDACLSPCQRPLLHHTLVQAPFPYYFVWVSTQHSQIGRNLQYSSASSTTQLKHQQLLGINKTQVSNKPVEAVLLKWTEIFIS